MRCIIRCCVVWNYVVIIESHQMIEFLHVIDVARLHSGLYIVITSKPSQSIKLIYMVYLKIKFTFKTNYFIYFFIYLYI